MQAAALAGTARAGDWPHWRGPQRNGVVGEGSGWTGERWPLSDPVWTTNVGQGASSPLVVAGRLYTMGWNADQDTLYCLDAATGEQLWKVSYPCPQYGRHSTGDKGIYSGASSTPEYDEQTGYLYTLSIDGDLQCWDTARRGARVWGINLYDQYQVKQRPDVGPKRNTLRDYGYTSSPLVHNDWVLAEVGAEAGTLIAFDKRTGRQQWASQCTDEAGHSGGPVPLTVEGVPCVALLTLRNLVVVRLDSGKEGQTVAQYAWETDFGNNIPTPAVQGNHVLVTSAYNQYAICKLEITLAGAKRLWQQDLASGVCSPIIHQKHIYWAWRGVHCLDLATGKPRWTGGKAGTAGSCIVTSDDRLIVWANQGELTLVETASRCDTEYTQLASRPRMFRTDAWPHVVLANARIYCKDRQGNLNCLALE